MRPLACSLASLFVFASLSARAQSAPPSAPPSAVPPAPEPTLAPATQAEAETSQNVAPPRREGARDAVWDLKYKEARTELTTGDFAQAYTHFAELAQTATNASDRALASELASVSGEWSRRGLAFVSRQDLGESNLSAKAVDKRTGDEIVSLYTNAVFYGLGSGIWFSTLANSSSSSAGTASYILPPLLGAGAAAGTVAIIDSGRGLRYGVAQSIVSGLYIGLEEGIGFSAWNSSRRGSDQMSTEAIATVIWASSTAGAVAGGVIGNAVGTTPGRASWVGSTALWSGLIVGFVGGAFASDDSGAGGALLAGTLALNAGAVFGLASAGGVSPSIARVRFIDLGGISGIILCDGLYLAAANKDPSAQATLGIGALGMAAGLTTAWFATSSMPKDYGARAPKEESARPGSIVAEATPTISPVQGGATVGLRGLLF